MHLFRPLTVGNMRLPNRIALTSLPSGHVSADGLLNETLCNYYVERARQGAGLITFEPAYVVAPTTPTPHLGLYNQHCEASFRTCIQQLRQSMVGVLIALDQPLTAADYDTDGLHSLADAWVAAALRAAAVGADGIMLSCADGGLFDQLLSPLTNQRTDDYGGSSTARSRLLCDVIERVMARLGRRFIVGVRLEIGEFRPGSLSLQDARVVAKRLVGTGVRLLEISAEAGDDVLVARFPGWRVPLAAAIKAVVDVPVMVGGLLADAELADSVIADGSADLVALGESLRTEPRWPHYAYAVLSAREG